MRNILAAVFFLIAVAIAADAPDAPTRTIGALVAVAVPIVMVVTAWIGDRGIIDDTDDE